jgi:hypothetical protein
MENNNQQIPEGAETSIYEDDIDEQPAVEEEKPKYDDRHSVVEIYTSVAKIDKNSETGILIPTSTFDEIEAYSIAIDKQEKEVFKSNFADNDSLASITANVNSADQTNHKDVYADNMSQDKDDWVNEVNYSDKMLGVRPLPLKANKGKVSGEEARARFISLLGLGETTQIPLWHSGIWITIRPPKDNEIIALDNSIANNEIILGRQTNTLIYSNYGVVFNRIVVDFILDHLLNTTVKLTEEEDIRDYIVTHDLYTLALGLISAIYPDGYNSTRACSNTTELTEEGKPKCSFVASGKLDPKKLLWINRVAVTRPMLEHMSKRSPNSVSLDEVKEYQASISKMSDKKINIQTSNGTDLEFTLSIPMLSKYINNGEYWVQNVISKAEDIFVSTDNAELKNNKVLDVLNAVVLGIYNVFVKSIQINGTYVEDQLGIDEVLDNISSDGNLLEKYTSAVRDFISYSAIAIVATPKFYCPDCGESHVSSAHKDKAFSDFIPLNVVENFFALSALKISLIRKRNITS